MPTETDEDATRADVETVRGDVTFEDVWFEYTEGRPVLRGVSFHAGPGTTTALVGSSGSGKSTLISLVMAFNRPTQGRILVDGRDLATLRLADYRQQVASVLQENFLFDGTILENVGYARPGAMVEEIKEACRIAHCDEFISRFPQGYETVVGERGIKLSGGQRQRVSIARAILADPRMLILDEATSSLDSESEQMIQDGLRRLRSGRTTFVIAHRCRRSAARSDPRDRGRADRGEGHACGTARVERTLSSAVRQAVQVRDGPVHQPGRGLHAGAGKAEDSVSRWECDMNPEFLVDGVLRSVLGGRHKRSGRAVRYLTRDISRGVEHVVRDTTRLAAGVNRGAGGFFTRPGTLLGALGLAWGIFETMQGQNAPRVQQEHQVQQAGEVRVPGVLQVHRSRSAGSADSQRGGACDAVTGCHAHGAAGGVRGRTQDGPMNEQERAAILLQARQAGVEAVFEPEIAQPRPLAEIVAGVTDPHERATLYVLAYTVLRATNR
jgi:ABC-type multidrug transport system ATPase subunit